MNLRHIIATDLAIVVASAAQALSLRFDPVVGVRTLPVVAWVQIESATSLKAEDQTNCGVEYTATVIKGISGVREGESLSFGYFLGRKVGTQYFVFLARSTGQRTTYTLSYPSLVNSAACTTVLPALREVAEGLGTIPIHRTSAGSTIVLDSMYQIVPLRLVSPEPKAGFIEDGIFHGKAEVSATRFANFLASETQ